MGCGHSSESPTEPKHHSNKVTPGNERPKNGFVVEPSAKATLKATKEPKATKSKETPADTPVEKKSVAFEIGFESSVDSIINKHPPKRLQRLAPLPESAPTLTTDQLTEKIRVAEENRSKELEKKKEVSRRSMKLRQEVMRAREIEKEQEERELDQKQQSANRAKQQKQEELAEKKRLREERAKRARERAKKMKEEGAEELDYELEKDDAFNQDDKDSWLDGDNNTSDYHTDNDRFNSGYDERIYSGHESPARLQGKTGNQARQKGISAVSSSTTDSYDYGHQRASATNTNSDSRYDRTQAKDDFFDS